MRRTTLAVSLLVLAVVPAAANIVMDSLPTQPPAERERMIDKIAQLKDTDAIWRGLFSDKPPEVRYWATVCAKRMIDYNHGSCDEQIVSSLTTTVQEDSSARLRQVSVEALGRISNIRSGYEDDETVIPPILEQATVDPDASVRAAAKKALTVFNANRAAEKARNERSANIVIFTIWGGMVIALAIVFVRNRLRKSRRRGGGNDGEGANDHDSTPPPPSMEEINERVDRLLQ